jgi:hypothetical protein
MTVKEVSALLYLPAHPLGALRRAAGLVAWGVAPVRVHTELFGAADLRAPARLPRATR